jgi:UDP-MurNAc hydroxylase
MKGLCVVTHSVAASTGSDAITSSDTLLPARNHIPESAIQYLGHAGFIVEHADTSILIDPWFYPAFLQSWFPYPDNCCLLPEVLDRRFDYLYVSHTHEDHFDRRFLEQLPRDITVLVAKYRSRSLVKKFRSLGFENVIALEHKQSIRLADQLTATIYLDTSHKEDSGLLLDIAGYRFLDLNDCNTPMSELPQDIDLLAAQFSGAMWYPNCYDYPPRVMAEKVATIRQDLMATLFRKVELTGAKAFLPSAGPACFLDPALDSYNDRDSTIFPTWEQVADSFRSASPQTEVIRLAPGDVIDLSVGIRVIQRPGRKLDESIAAYRERRRTEWEEYYSGPEPRVTAGEIAEYFGTLQRRNKRFLGDYKKHIRLISGTQNWDISLGQLAGQFVIEGEEPYDPAYTVLVSPRTLRLIIDGETGWEEALLSMRLGLHREPDVFDLTFMSLLRYGNQPAQTMQMLRERQNTETITRDGLLLQRFCPHAGEDLSFAKIENGRIECPRHHWIWDARTGECIEKASINLRVEVLEDGDPALRTEAVGHRETHNGEK